MLALVLAEILANEFWRRPEAPFDLLEAFHHLLARDGPRQDVIDENGVHGVAPIRGLTTANNTVGDVRRPRRDAEGWRHAHGLREDRGVGDIESGMVVNLAGTGGVSPRARMT